MSETTDDGVVLQPAAPRPPKVILGLLAGNLAVSAFILFKVMGAQPHVTPAHAAEIQEGVRKEVVGPLIALDPFVVNLDEQGTPRYLKLTVQVEVKDGGVARTLDKNKTLVRDALLGHLSGLKVSETLGAESKDRIRAEMEERVSEIVGEGGVRRIVFEEFVVQ